MFYGRLFSASGLVASSLDCDFQYHEGQYYISCYFRVENATMDQLPYLEQIVLDHRGTLMIFQDINATRYTIDGNARVCLKTQSRRMACTTRDKLEQTVTTNEHQPEQSSTNSGETPEV